MPEEALVTGQSGQTATSGPQVGIDTGNGATIQASGSDAPNAEQPLTLTKGQLDQYINDALNAQKQTWLNEAYQNTQSMNDKFEKRVNDTIAQFEKVGIKADKVTAAKYLREQDKQSAQANVQAQAQGQQRIDPAYAQFLGRFGSRDASDPRLQGAFSLEQDYGIQLNRDDPEFTEFFGDPNKRWKNSYAFTRDYERALEKKKERTADNPQSTIAGMPSLSGNGPKSNAIPNTMSSDDIYDKAFAERRNSKR